MNSCHFNDIVSTFLHVITCKWRSCAYNIKWSSAGLMHEHFFLKSRWTNGSHFDYILSTFLLVTTCNWKVFYLLPNHTLNCREHISDIYHFAIYISLVHFKTILSKYFSNFQWKNFTMQNSTFLYVLFVKFNQAIKITIENIYFCQIPTMYFIIISENSVCLLSGCQNNC